MTNQERRQFRAWRQKEITSQASILRHVRRQSAQRWKLDEKRHRAVSPEAVFSCLRRIQDAVIKLHHELLHAISLKH